MRDAGRVGMTLGNRAEDGSEELLADCHLIPTIHIGAKAANAIKEYTKTDKNPTALVVTGAPEVYVRPTPVVAGISSRGPYYTSMQILKPDVIGPGIDILGAWPDDMSPTELDIEKRRVQFNILAGSLTGHTSLVLPLLSKQSSTWRTLSRSLNLF